MATIWCAMYPCCGCALAKERTMGKVLCTRLYCGIIQEKYVGFIYPLDNIKDWEQVPGLVKPPPVLTQPGRPKKLRVRQEDEPVAQSNRRCTKCGSQGHNTRTCSRRKYGN
ncbi:hypothetical protein ACHQM5_013530 [Ranunculus cassubicifolius]